MTRSVPRCYVAMLQFYALARCQPSGAFVVLCRDEPQRIDQRSLSSAKSTRASIRPLPVERKFAPSHDTWGESTYNIYILAP